MSVHFKKLVMSNNCGRLSEKVSCLATSLFNGHKPFGEDNSNARDVTILQVQDTVFHLKWSIMTRPSSAELSQCNRTSPCARNHNDWTFVHIHACSLKCFIAAWKHIKYYFYACQFDTGDECQLTGFGNAHANVFWSCHQRFAFDVSYSKWAGSLFYTYNTSLRTHWMLNKKSPRGITAFSPFIVFRGRSEAWNDNICESHERSAVLQPNAPACI